MQRFDCGVKLNNFHERARNLKLPILRTINVWVAKTMDIIKGLNLETLPNLLSRYEEFTTIIQRILDRFIPHEEHRKVRAWMRIPSNSPKILRRIRFLTSEKNLNLLIEAAKGSGELPKEKLKYIVLRNEGRELHAEIHLTEFIVDHLHDSGPCIQYEIGIYNFFVDFGSS